MGTRADFYVGRGENAEWLGSIAWDGYEIPDSLKDCKDEEVWRSFVSAFLKQRDDGTTPDMGWPWPWKDSRTTDEIYAFDNEQVYQASFGYYWRKVDEEELDEKRYPEVYEKKTCVFPDMSNITSLAMGTERDSIMFLGES